MGGGESYFYVYRLFLSYGICLEMKGSREGFICLCKPGEWWWFHLLLSVRRVVKASAPCIHCYVTVRNVMEISGETCFVSYRGSFFSCLSGERLKKGRERRRGGEGQSFRCIEAIDDAGFTTARYNRALISALSNNISFIQFGVAVCFLVCMFIFNYMFCCFFVFIIFHVFGDCTEGEIVCFIF